MTSIVHTTYADWVKIGVGHGLLITLVITPYRSSIRAVTELLGSTSFSYPSYSRIGSLDMEFSNFGFLVLHISYIYFHKSKFYSAS